MREERLVDNEAVAVLRMVLGPFENNVYLVRDKKNACCIVIDAAAEAERIWQAVNGDRLLAILLTHTHVDHIQALDALRRKSGAPVGVHPLEPEAQRSHPDISLEDGQRVALGDHHLEVIHTPGHTPGSVCFLLRPDLCFCGDTVFPGGPGKTGGPEAFLKIVESLERKVYTLPKDVRLLPGHGEGILVGQSQREYESFRSRPRDGIPWGDILWEES